MNQMQLIEGRGANTPIPFANTPEANLASRIKERMLSVIEENQFKVAKVYPKDLEIDAQMLERMAVDGAKIAWVVGDTHTHLVVVGLEPEQNSLVRCFTNMFASDKFYLIQIKRGNVNFEEKTRTEFGNLCHEPIPYSSSGDRQHFTICKGSLPLATCSIEKDGTWGKPRYKVSVTPRSSMTPLDRNAIEYWCHRATNIAAGSLFVSRDIVWAA